jgi:hypothetical protein
LFDKILYRGICGWLFGGVYLNGPCQLPDLHCAVIDYFYYSIAGYLIAVISVVCTGPIEGVYQPFAALYKGRGVTSEQQKPHVQHNKSSMQRHIHMHMVSTYFNIPHVEKNAYPTWERAPNQTLITQHNAVQTQSCGS